MGEPHRTRCAETDERLERLMNEMEAAGVPRVVIEDAVRRAKLKTAVRRTQSSNPPPSRQPLDTNPELDAWFDS